MDDGLPEEARTQEIGTAQYPFLQPCRIPDAPFDYFMNAGVSRVVVPDTDTGFANPGPEQGA